MAGRRGVCKLSAREICKNELSVWSARYNSITNDSLGPIFSSSPKDGLAAKNIFSLLAVF